MSNEFNDICAKGSVKKSSLQLIHLNKMICVKENRTLVGEI